MGSHDPLGYLKHKLWPKEGPGIKDWKKKKILVSKFDFLIKHAWLKKCITIQREVIIVACILNYINAHVKNEKLYTTIGFDIIFVQIVNVGKAKNK